MSRENSSDSSTSFLANLIHPFPPSFFHSMNAWWRGVLLVAMALDRQGRCETIRDTKRKLFCICTCSYTTASSPENDDRIHCFRKSSCRQLRVRLMFSVYFPTMFISEWTFYAISVLALVPIIVVLLRIECKLLRYKMEEKTRLRFKDPFKRCNKRRISALQNN